MTFKQWLADFSRSRQARDMWVAAQAAQVNLIDACLMVDDAVPLHHRVHLFRPGVVTHRADTRSVAVDVAQVVRRVPNSIFSMGGLFVALDLVSCVNPLDLAPCENDSRGMGCNPMATDPGPRSGRYVGSLNAAAAVALKQT